MPAALQWRAWWRMATGSFPPVEGDALFQSKHAFPGTGPPSGFYALIWHCGAGQHEERGPPGSLALDSAFQNSALFPQEKKRGCSLAEKRPTTCIGENFQSALSLSTVN